MINGLRVNNTGYEISWIGVIGVFVVEGCFFHDKFSAKAHIVDVFFLYIIGYFVDVDELEEVGYILPDGSVASSVKFLFILRYT